MLERWSAGALEQVLTGDGAGDVNVSEVVDNENDGVISVMVDVSDEVEDKSVVDVEILELDLDVVSVVVVVVVVEDDVDEVAWS